MAERNDEVMEMVGRELERQPNMELRELHEKAVEIDPSMAELTPRQFNARYPLQVKRMRSGGGRGKRRPQSDANAGEAKPRATRRRTNPAQSRDAVREVFLRFAGDFAQAESRSEIVSVLSNVDTYVDGVVELFQRSPGRSR